MPTFIIHTTGAPERSVEADHYVQSGDFFNFFNSNGGRYQDVVLTHRASSVVFIERKADSE